MSSRKPGQTLRENQRWLNRQTLRITLAAAPVALLLIVVFLRELVNTLMGNHSPIRAIVGLLLLMGLMGVVYLIQFLDRRERIFHIGARGEERVGEALETLRQHGWHIFHDIALPTVGNIDHVAVGTKGVFIVETKNHTGTIVLENGRLARVGRPLEKDFVAQAMRQAAALGHLIHQRTGLRVFVQPVVCFVRARLLLQSPRVQQAVVLSYAELLNYLHRHPDGRLTSTQVSAIASVLAQLNR
ncbi:Nuclease-related domain-containing protein [Armatimonadetes bacterium GBS]|jgi:Holliday junction resolvase-like predicted endonuclease|nr:MAG: hypothetical protein KatS3mg021_2086 [Fimbriimonadales bacterium]CUU10563.1 Nuclease-related domain-containing protein [Armatimonadetes bacterium GBS]